LASIKQTHGEYFTKNHPEAHHWLIRPLYLESQVNLASLPSHVGECIGTHVWASVNVFQATCHL